MVAARASAAQGAAQGFGFGATKTMHAMIKAMRHHLIMQPAFPRALLDVLRIAPLPQPVPLVW